MKKNLRYKNILIIFCLVAVLLLTACSQKPQVLHIDGEVKVISETAYKPPESTEKSATTEATEIATTEIPTTELPETEITDATEESSEPTEPSEATAPDPTTSSEAHTHSYNSAGTTSPTCTEKGYTLYKCSCGASYKDNYKNALGHSYTSSTVSSERSGSYLIEKIKYTCSRCGYSYTDEKKTEVKPYNTSTITSTYNSYAASAYGFKIDTSLNSGNASCAYSYSGKINSDADLENRAKNIINSTASLLASQLGISASQLGSYGAKGNFVASYNESTGNYTFVFYYK